MRQIKGPYDTWASRLASLHTPRAVLPCRALNTLDLISSYAKASQSRGHGLFSSPIHQSMGIRGGFDSLAVRILAPRSRILCGPVLSLLLGTCLGMERLEEWLSRAAAPFHVLSSSVRAPAHTLADAGHCQPSWHSPSSESEVGSACGFRWHFPKCLSSCTPRALGHLLGRNVYLGPLPNF